MHTNETTREVMLSQLVDGELDNDQANDVLFQVLDDETSREQLKEHLRLRQSLSAWRKQTPDRPVRLQNGVDTSGRRSWASRLGTLAAAAVLGGVLVGAGFLLAVLGKQQEPAVTGAGMVTVTAQQQAELAAAFRLHESVAGPLVAYAADDNNVQLVSAEGSRLVGQPIGIMLRLGPGDQSQEARTYAIACRADRAATIELPSTVLSDPVRLYLVPTVADGRIDIEYAIAVGDPAGTRGRSAALVGRRHLGLRPASLGQMVIANRCVGVDAVAWVIRDGTAQ